MDALLISKNGNFVLYKYNGVGAKDTPYTALKIKSCSDADKHVVEIRLDTDMPRFEGNAVQYKINDIYIAHGMRSCKDTVAETVELINVLQEAVDFIPRIRDYLENNREWLA